MKGWQIIAIIVGVVATLGATFYLGDSYGVARANSKWQTRENTELTAKNDKILELTAKARAREKANAEALNDISLRNQQELRNAKAQYDRDVAAVRAGALRLRDAAARQASGGSTPGAAGAGASGRDGGAGTELSREATEFLLGEAARADEITRQLGQCQDVVRADRSL